MPSCQRPLPEHFHHLTPCPTHPGLIPISTDSFCLYLNERHVSEIMHFPRVYVWLLSFSMFLGVIHVLAKHSGGFIVEECSLSGYNTAYPLSRGLASWLYPVFVIMNKEATNVLT